MAEVAEKRKRQRLNPIHRWTDSETIDLLENIVDEVKANPEAFEKPTAQVFYTKIAGKMSSSEVPSWTLMKSKVRNLKTTYQKVVSGESQQICPYWEFLEQIFGHCESVTPVGVLETSSDNYDDAEPSSNDTNVADSYIPDPFAVKLECVTEEPILDDADADGGTEPAQSTTGLNFTTFNNHLKHPLKRDKVTANPGSTSLLVDIQEKRLKFEEKKWHQQMELEEKKLQLAKMQAENEVELKRMELSHQLEIKKLELEKEERLEMVRMKLDMEYKEKIKMYELKLNADK
ncbi:uncharacterized protein LOC128746269 [Sabethes cyaneus]|uniref:uncharacterized protein LOC128746269 n=1 Tax=Sabethes cyaneus TaxID=53552 RepID=UPI00237E2859|nr:uncharacterized protein LOC128746269 [Sabethes cyaneus]